jgi:hypothetical protein
MLRARTLLICGLLLCAGAAWAEDVGTVASVRGVADIGRAGARSPAVVGGVVQLGDELHTGADGQLRVVFRDESVIDLAEGSSLVVDKQVFDPDASQYTSLVKLLQGKARALVGAYYRTPGASYEVQTPTAVAGVRGTSFMVAYYPDAEATEVIGIHGQIQVRSVSERIGESVFITAHESTTVYRDSAPSAPEPIDDQRFRREVDGLQVLALGNVGSFATSPLRAGGTVPAPDRAPSSSGLAGQLGRDQLRNSGDVAGQPLPVVGATRGSLGIPF